MKAILKEMGIEAGKEIGMRFLAILGVASSTWSIIAVVCAVVAVTALVDKVLDKHAKKA